MVRSFGCSVLLNRWGEEQNQSMENNEKTFVEIQAKVDSGQKHDCR